MLNYTLGTIEASEALIKDLYIDLRAKANAWSKIANIKSVIKKYSPSARVNGLNKEKLLQLLEDIRKNNNITNADLCNKFADEIYLPKIVLKKADIPLSLRSQFIDLR